MTPPKSQPETSPPLVSDPHPRNALFDQCATTIASEHTVAPCRTSVMVAISKSGTRCGQNPNRNSTHFPSVVYLAGRVLPDIAQSRNQGMRELEYIYRMLRVLARVCEDTRASVPCATGSSQKWWTMGVRSSRRGRTRASIMPVQDHTTKSRHPDRHRCWSGTDYRHHVARQDKIRSRAFEYGVPV